MQGTPLLDRIQARKGTQPCEACGSPDPRPVTHKTWCSVRILAPSLHRPAADLTGWLYGASVPDGSDGAA